MRYIAKLLAGWLADLLIWPYNRIVLKICNLSLCRKIFEHCHFIQTITLVDEMILKIQSKPSQFGYVIFFKNSLADFLKKNPRFFRVLFLRSKTYLLNSGTSVRLFVSSSVIGFAILF